jgi:hypothetical protein
MKPATQTINVRTLPGSKVKSREVNTRVFKCGWFMRYPSDHNDIEHPKAYLFYDSEGHQLFLVTDGALAFDIGIALDTRL